MVKVLLINMPFASTQTPSIGLTQIKSRLDSCFTGRVSTEILYLNIDFSHYMGIEFYNDIAESIDHHPTGLGDWIFRQVAFPELLNNANEYFKRCYPHPTEQNAFLRKLVEKKRSDLSNILNELIDSYHIERADIVGFTSMFMQNVACIAMARLLKERRPDIITVMGGANCETTMGREIVRNVGVVDFVFSGPGLISFPQFIGYYLEGKYDEMHTINGVFSSKNQISGQKQVAAIGEELDINAEIKLDYKTFIEKYKNTYPDSQKKPSLLFETSRGCWWGEKAHCMFCGLNSEKMSYRAMPPDRAITLIESMYPYTETCHLLRCVDNIMPRQYVQEVFARISPPSQTRFFYEVRANLSDDELKILSKAGVRSIQPGIESLATSTLQLMRKGTTGTQNVQFLRNCLMNGVTPFWNLLIGFPGEVEEVYKKYCTDIPLLSHLPPPSGIFPVRFDRYSPYFNRAGEYKLDLHPMAYYELTYPFDKQVVSNMAYYFANYNCNDGYYMAMIKWLGKMREAVDHWRKLWENTVKPKLHFSTGNDGGIVDTRTGSETLHDVGSCGRQMLESLYQPKTISMLMREFTGIAVTRELDALRAKGLVFSEGDRWVSLVCLSEPPISENIS